MKFPIIVKQHKTLTGSDGVPLDLDDVARVANAVPDLERVVASFIHQARSGLIPDGRLIDEALAASAASRI